MRCRTVLLTLSVLGGLGLVALAAWLLLPSPERVCRGNFERIEEGMSETAVVELLGEPLGREPTAGQGVGYASRAFWYGDRGMIEVHFDEDATVLDASFIDFPPPSPGLRERLWAALGW